MVDPAKKTTETPVCQTKMEYRELKNDSVSVFITRKPMLVCDESRLKPANEAQAEDLYLRDAPKLRFRRINRQRPAWVKAYQQNLSLGPYWVVVANHCEKGDRTCRRAGFYEAAAILAVESRCPKFNVIEELLDEEGNRQGSIIGKYKGYAADLQTSATYAEDLRDGTFVVYEAFYLGAAKIICLDPNDESDIEIP